MKALNLIFLVIFCFLFGCSYIQKKSFERQFLNKEKIEDCRSREKNKCNDERNFCKLKDKKDDKVCEGEYKKCLENSVLECEKKY